MRKSRWWCLLKEAHHIKNVPALPATYDTGGSLVPRAAYELQEQSEPQRGARSEAPPRRTNQRYLPLLDHMGRAPSAFRAAQPR